MQEMIVLQTEYEGRKKEEEKTDSAGLKETAEREEGPVIIPAVGLAGEKRDYGLLWRTGLAALLLGLMIWGYPKVSPVLDGAVHLLLQAASPAETVSSGEEESSSDSVPEEQEETKPEEPQDGQEDTEQELLPEEEEVVGTIDNMTGQGEISVQTFSADAGGIYLPLAHGLVKNVTEVPNTILRKESKKELPFSFADTESPQILIMHTHTTESYLSRESGSYDTKASFRTRDESQNITRVGKAVAEELAAAGIPVLHDTTLHDYPSYSGSYERSAETVRKYLKKYPEIKVVLDIHRDAIGSDSTLIAPTAEIDRKKAAQIMIISGCDDGTMDMPLYLQNFRFAAALQTRLEQMYPTLTRPVLFDYRKYNQDLTTGSLLIEIGSNGNTLGQAVYSGKLLGKALAELYRAEQDG